MKQRLTYIVRDVFQFSTSQLTVKSDSIYVAVLDAAKEQHLTLGLDELPQEIWRVLKQCHELHLRWASPTAYEAVAPYVSRVSPGGLHAFFTPRRGQPTDLLCPLFKKLFGDDLKCESPEATFVSQPILSERFSSSASFSYFEVLSGVQWRNFLTYLGQKGCGTDAACARSIAAVQDAQYLDFDYDAISHAVVLKAYWDKPTGGKTAWSDTTKLTPRVTSVEVGALNNEVSMEPEELELAGFLTVLGQNTEPKSTLFSFPARHHPLSPSRNATYSVSFKHPTGLHPTLQIELPSRALEPPHAHEHCALHTYLTLPSNLFIDRYQFGDSLFLKSQNLRQLHSLSGETDLEAPAYVVQKWGSAALFELAHPSLKKQLQGTWRASIPLHLRYMQPTNDTEGQAQATLPWPVVFWACDAEEGLKMSSSPFDRVNLGYDGLFGPRTLFYHIPPAPGAHMVETLNVPVLSLANARAIEVGTVAAIVVGTLYVCWKLFRAIAPASKGTPQAGKQKKRQ